MALPAQTPLLLSPSELRSLHTRPILLDCSWYLPNSPRKAREEYQTKRIEGTTGYLDLDDIGPGHPLGLKHMMPSARVFADTCESLAIDRESHIVFYDTWGNYSAPRALYMFRLFGHANSSILDGGLPRWEAEGFPVETNTPIAVTCRSKYALPDFDISRIISYDQIVSYTQQNNSGDSIILDARPAGRFTGHEPEPRPDVPSGHMPNSFSVPFDSFMQKQSSESGLNYTFFASPSTIAKTLTARLGESLSSQILDNSHSVVVTCGSGMTACVLWLGLTLLGVVDVRLYDESWAGYALQKSSSIISTSG